MCLLNLSSLSSNSGSYKDKIKHVVIMGEEERKKARLEALFGKERIVDRDAVDYLSQIS